VNDAEVRQELVAAALALGVIEPWPECEPALLYGPLFAELHDGGDSTYPVAIELIYEGYLLHYRDTRVLAQPVSCQAGLLAGDYFYARGLRYLAARGDVAAVDLLTRLMAACSYLRVAGAPFAADDDLWSFTVAALAALCRGAGDEPALALFSEFERLVADAALDELHDSVLQAATALPLACRRPLVRHLAGAALVAAGREG
jgi:hypothetical protein